MENNEDELACYDPGFHFSEAHAILADYLVNGKPADMPQEVWVVINWPYELVGIETYNKIEAVKVKYPEYFPWEAKYRSIPQSVHDAYAAELHPGGLLNSLWDPKEAPKEGNPGLIALINENGLMSTYDSSKPFTFADFAEIADRHIKKRQLEFKQIRKEQALWDKYYKPFNLPYRR